MHPLIWVIWHVESQPSPRNVLDQLLGCAPERPLDRLERILGSQQRIDVLLGEIERHRRQGYFFGMKLIFPFASSTAHWTSASDEI